MELKEKLKSTIDKISKQNKADSKKLFALLVLAILTAVATFFEIPEVATNIAFAVISILSLKHFLRIQECGRLKNKLISLVKDLEQGK